MRCKLAVFGTVLLAVLSGARAAPPLTNAVSIDRILVVDPSSMSIGGGKATLTIGVLQRVPGGFLGEYHINVFPYVFKNEKGKLSILASDDSLAQLGLGKAIAITGTATTIGKKGKTRPIEATTTPADQDRGTLRLWFMAGERKMIFEPAYHFAANGNVQATSEDPAKRP